MGNFYNIPQGSRTRGGSSPFKSGGSRTYCPPPTFTPWKKENNTRKILNKEYSVELLGRGLQMGESKFYIIYRIKPRKSPRMAIRNCSYVPVPQLIENIPSAVTQQSHPLIMLMFSEFCWQFAGPFGRLQVTWVTICWSQVEWSEIKKSDLSWLSSNIIGQASEIRIVTSLTGLSWGP